MQSNQCQSNESHVENVSKKSLIRTQPFFMYATVLCSHDEHYDFLQRFLLLFKIFNS